jgi:hypothetical protein
MKVGTKSLLFGAHQFLLHPIFVAIAWTKLYGFPKDIRLWVAFIVHDWGYWGKPNMDGKGEGEEHPLLGAKIMKRLFDGKSNIPNTYWYNFMLYHSRFYAKLNHRPISKLCVADKYVFCIENKWFYLFRATLSGEVYEYMDENKNRSGHSYKGKSDWFNHVNKFMTNWVNEHKDNFKND